jgi:Leucine-rich repeat (LRR) protein
LFQKYYQFILFHRNFITFIGFASLVAATELHCEFSFYEWQSFDHNLQVCKIQKPVNDNESVISFPQNSTIEALSINHNKETLFIPNNLSTTFPNLLAIAVFNCSVQSITGSNFRGLRKLTFLILGQNKIEYIEGNAFKDNTNIETLSLDHNNLKSVSGEVFESLRNLKRLWLNNNQITYIDSSSFKSLRNLDSLYLQYNKIREFDPQTFDSLVNLRTLMLNHNQLETIDGNLLKNNKKLKSIDLDKNNLKSVDSKAFDGMKNLDQVNLEGNMCISGKFIGSEELVEMKVEISHKC